MDEVPKLRKNSNRKPINIVIDPDMDALYRLGKQNGWDTAEIARKAVQEELKRLETKLRKIAS
jgi:hypothetical protein